MEPSQNEVCTQFTPYQMFLTGTISQSRAVAGDLMHSTILECFRSWGWRVNLSIISTSVNGNRVSLQNLCASHSLSPRCLKNYFCSFFLSLVNCLVYQSHSAIFYVYRYELRYAKRGRPRSEVEPARLKSPRKKCKQPSLRSDRRY